MSIPAYFWQNLFWYKKIFVLPLTRGTVVNISALNPTTKSVPTDNILSVLVYSCPILPKCILAKKDFFSD
jgi:hypothetical protein